MNKDYLACYLALEVEPGCDRTQLRRSYLRLVRAWHPDRFHQQPERQALAEEKIKEINQAYQVLSGYCDRHGNLPGASPGRERHSLDGTGDRCPAEEPRRPWAPSAALTDPEWSTSPLARPAAKSSNLLRLVLIGLTAWAIYALLWPQGQAPAPLPVPKYGRPFTSSSQPSQARPASTGMNNPTGNNEFFTVGSTQDEVQAVQGIPDSIRNGVWYYGKSRVYFVDGTVLRWVNDPSDPLRVAFDIPRTHHRPTTFSVGSPKALVRSIQGRPLLETAHEWDYGVSKVYFADGRVTGWYNSPFSPLNVAMSAP